MAEITQEKNNIVDIVVSVRRVTKVTKGGKRFSFSAFVVSGDQASSVGIGNGKARDVQLAIAKAMARARKNMFKVALRGATLPYDVRGTHGASEVVLRPASAGTGVIAGGPVRSVMKALGIHDVLAKSIGTRKCAHNVVKATLNALAQCRTIEEMAKLRGKTPTQIMKGAHNVAA